MSHTLVMKFGGTSVGTLTAMRQAVAIVAEQYSRWAQVVVVTSALSGVTDLLIRSAQCAAQGDLSCCYSVARELSERHHGLVDELVPDLARCNQVHQDVNHLLADFGNLCQAIHLLAEASPRALDAVASLGERLSVRIFAAAIEAAGLPAQFVESTQVICTDGRFQNACPDMTITRERAQAVLIPILNQGWVPVVTGFIGATSEGVTTTLGRGGSDYSASILAVVLEANEVWIWTDVDGVMTSDPHLVTDARTLSEISFREVAEMAHYGAKVLHPKSIQPVIEAGIVLRVCNTFNPANAGTRLVAEVRGSLGVIKALAVIRGLKIITLTGTGMLGVPGVAGRIFSAVATTGVSIPLIIESTSEQAICFPVPIQAVEAVLQSLYTHLRQDFERGDMDRALTSDEVDIITVISSNLRETPGVAGQIFGVLAAAGITVLGISFGASDVSINLIVRAADTRAALQALHSLV